MTMPGGSSQDTDSGMRDSVGAVIDAAVSSGRIVGTVVLVSRNGHLVYRAAAGFADRKSKQSMRFDSIFRFASLTKPIVSAAALVLLERKVLDLEDPVVKFVANFRPQLPDGREPAEDWRRADPHIQGNGLACQ